MSTGSSRCLDVERIIKNPWRGIRRCARGFVCGAKESRTPDLLNAIQALYQLSYSPGVKVSFTVQGHINVGAWRKFAGKLRVSSFGFRVVVLIGKIIRNAKFETRISDGTAFLLHYLAKNCSKLWILSSSRPPAFTIHQHLHSDPMSLSDSSSWRVMKVDGAMLSTCDAFLQVRRIVERHDEGRLILVVGPDREAVGSYPKSELYVDEFSPELLDEQRLEAYRTLALSICEKVTTFHSPFERKILLPLRLAAALLHVFLNGEEAGFLVAEAVDVFEKPEPFRDGFLAGDSAGIPIVIGGLTRYSSKEIGFLQPAGTDQTAARIAELLEAESLTMYTAETGILSADPSLTPGTHRIAALSYHEAAQIAFWNNGILHPKSLIYPLHADLRLEVKPFWDYEAAGTVISSDLSNAEHLAKAVTARDELCLLVLEGLGMKEVVGIMARALEVLAEASVNVVLLSQASTEQSAGIVIGHEEKDRGLTILREQFAAELDAGDIERIYSLDPVGIVTAVDDHMRYQPGLTGQMFSTFGRSGINVLTMADGASENNISAVVDGQDLPAAVQALHEAFCLGRRRAHVFLFGAGTIGRQLLELMEQLSAQWLEHLNLHICLVGLANSRHMVWNKRGIEFDEALRQLNAAALARDLEAIVDHLATSRLDRLIVIDATASNEIAELYPVLLEHNIAVVTPNKRANTLDSAFYDRLHRAAREHQVPYFYETTVGAGLPVISTLRDLIRSGDEIVRVQGVFSGTLAYLFNSVSEGRPFGEALREAYTLGYTEPDPRDDLSGEDVARKTLILAREMGLRLEREDIVLEPFLSDELMEMPAADFVENMESLLVDWKPPKAVAKAKRLHFVGTIENGAIRIGLASIEDSSPFAQLQGTDNLIVYTTRRYFDNPLVIRGPGAGPAVTAGGVLADVIRAAELVT